MARRARTAVSSVLVVTLALTAAGCGKSAVARFGDRLKPLEERAQEQKAQLSSTLVTVQLQNRGDANRLRQEIESLGRVEGEIARVRGPDQVRAPLAARVRAGAAQLTALRRFADALEIGSRAALTRAAKQVPVTEGAIRRADDALHARIGAG